MNEHLWADFGTRAFMLVLVQDLALALALVAGLALALHRPTWRRLIAAYALAAFALALLLIDARIRQIWIQPTSLNLVRYCWKFAPDLTAGADMFFNFPSGLGASFRKWLVYLMAVQLGYHLLMAFGLRRFCYRSPRLPRIRARHIAGASAGAAVVLGVIGMWVPSHMYSAEQNILVAKVLSPLGFEGDLSRIPTAFS